LAQNLVPVDLAPQCGQNFGPLSAVVAAAVGAVGGARDGAGDVLRAAALLLLLCCACRLLAH